MRLGLVFLLFFGCIVINNSIAANPKCEVAQRIFLLSEETKKELLSQRDENDIAKNTVIYHQLLGIKNLENKVRDWAKEHNCPIST